LKVAGEEKTEVLLAAAVAGPPATEVLEIGTYCGYSAILLATALPGVHVTTLEVDPVHVVIARNLVGLAGSSGRISVCTGHSSALLPLLSTPPQQACFRRRVHGPERLALQRGPR